MNLPDGLRKHSFRKWYERELFSSHAHMLLLFLCTIGLLAAFEVYSKSASKIDQVIDVLAVILFTVVGVWSLRRYLYLLMHAEQVANQAVCKQCDTYGRFSLVEEDRPGSQVKVRCKKCQHEWPISH
jgi:predicted Zn finger-like uncharacterized protein